MGHGPVDLARPSYFQSTLINLVGVFQLDHIFLLQVAAQPQSDGEMALGVAVMQGNAVTPADRRRDGSALGHGRNGAACYSKGHLL